MASLRERSGSQALLRPPKDEPGRPVSRRLVDVLQDVAAEEVGYRNDPLVVPIRRR